VGLVLIGIRAVLGIAYNRITQKKPYRTYFFGEGFGDQIS
jgi:hypothetical protein